MEAEQLISLYSALFYASMALCILGFLMAVAFFFLFDIRKIYTQITGHGKERLMQRANKESQKLEKKRNTAGIRSSDLYSGGVTGGVAPPEQAGGAPQTMAHEEATTMLQHQAPAAETEATVVLPSSGSEGNNSDSTTVLPRAAAVGLFEIFESVIEIHTDEII